MITALIATIIHMNMGFEMPEALGRGVVSAALIWAALFVLQMVVLFVMSLVGRR